MPEHFVSASKLLLLEKKAENLVKIWNELFFASASGENLVHDLIKTSHSTLDTNERPTVVFAGKRLKHLESREILIIRLPKVLYASTVEGYVILRGKNTLFVQ